MTSRFLFIHVMKTGGTSLMVHALSEFRPGEIYPDPALDRRAPDDVEPYASFADLVSLAPERKAAIRLYAGHLPFAARDVIGPGTQTITLLRDPVERTVSVLKHFKRLRPRYRDLALEEIYVDPVVFRFFVENHQTKVFAVTANDRPDAFSSSLSFDEIRTRLDVAGADEAARANPTGPNPRTAVPDTITVDAGRLALAKANLAAVDVIGCDDRFHDFVETLREQFGWWSSGIDERPRANVSEEPWEASADLRARIAADNRFDLELYAHAQDLLRERRS